MRVMHLLTTFYQILSKHFFFHWKVSTELQDLWDLLNNDWIRLFVCWYSFPTVCILTFYFSFHLFYPFTFLFISLTSDFISIYIHTLKHKLLSVVSTAPSDNTFIYKMFFIFLTHMSQPKKSLTKINQVFIFSQNHFLFIYYIVTHFPFFSASDCNK